MKRSEKLILLIPALWTSLFDTAITILLQPKEYWGGDLEAGNEGNPIGALFMRNHVSGLFVISIFWLILIGVLGYYLPRKISRVFLLFVFVAHNFGASTWLSRYGFWYAIAVILFNSILFYVINDIVDKDIPQPPL